MFNGSCWVLAIALFGVYCGLRSSGELERRAAIADFFLPRGVPSAAETSIVEPAEFRALDAQR